MAYENSNPLIVRGNMALEDGAFGEATEHFNRALDTDPTAAEAYLGLFMAEIKAKDKGEAKQKYAAGNYTGDRYWNRAKQFASGELAAELLNWEALRANFGIDEMKYIQVQLKNIFRQMQNAAQTDIGRLEREIAEKKVQLENLGFFTGARKRTLQTQIDQLTGEIASMKRAAAEKAVENHKLLDSYTPVFGTYNCEAIEWKILAVEQHRALLTSKYVLGDKPYNERAEDVTWETCTLRRWLNGVFLNATFNSAEHACILTVTVPADQNPQYSTVNPGKATQDKIFLLSIPEVEKYFNSDSERTCCGTGGGSRWWWLRSPGSISFNAAVVLNDGSVYYGGNSVGIPYGVRPALWINLDS